MDDSAVGVRALQEVAADAVTRATRATLPAELADSCEPHRLCGYLFSLAKAFTEFYESGPVLAAESGPVRANRVALCQLTGANRGRGLHLLGIETLERM